MPKPIVLGRRKRRTTGTVALGCIVIGIATYALLPGKHSVAGLTALGLAGVGLGVFLLERAQGSGTVLDARGLRDALGFVPWGDVRQITRTSVGARVLLRLTLPRERYRARWHPHDDGQDASSEIEWAFEISGGDIGPDAIESSVREWRSGSGERRAVDDT